jgi:hypothetical protein
VPVLKIRWPTPGPKDHDTEANYRRQTLADIAKGETTASALENHLSALEGKVDELLAFFEGQSSDLEQTTSRGEHQGKEQGVDLKPAERRP